MAHFLKNTLRKSAPEDRCLRPISTFLKLHCLRACRVQTSRKPRPFLLEKDLFVKMRDRKGQKIIGRKRELPNSKQHSPVNADSCAAFDVCSCSRSEQCRKIENFLSLRKCNYLQHPHASNAACVNQP